MTDADAYRLLHGPYTPPAVHVGDRTVCLARDWDVKVTTWTNARISWPRCQAIGQCGDNGILVEEELARAIRCESALAIGSWWGVICKTVAWWRRVLGVNRINNDGSHRRIVAASAAGGEVTRSKPMTPDQVEERRRVAIKLNLARHLEPYRTPNGRPWTAEELAALGTAPDAELAQRFGRTEEAIRVRRDKLGIDRAPGDNARRPWEAWEDALVLRLPVKDAAARTGRTRTAVYQRRMAVREVERYWIH